jgi:hypothetical protein
VICLAVESSVQRAARGGGFDDSPAFRCSGLISPCGLCAAVRVTRSPRDRIGIGDRRFKQRHGDTHDDGADGRAARSSLRIRPPWTADTIRATRSSSNLLSMRTSAKCAANASSLSSFVKRQRLAGPVVARRDQRADAGSSASRFSRSTRRLRAHLGTRCRASARPSA